MIVSIVILSIILFVSIIFNIISFKANMKWAQYWTETENERWLQSMKETGCEVVLK